MRLTPGDALFEYRITYADTVEWYRQWQETLDPTQFFDQVFGVSRVPRNKAPRSSLATRLLAMIYRVPNCGRMGTE